MTMKDSIELFVEKKELQTIATLGVVERLRRVANIEGGIQKFGIAFYPIRSSFVRTCFIAGSRCQMHEVLWSGLARNLYEEAGGGVTPAHNELYRRFLRSVGVFSDDGIEELPFSVEFNQAWRSFASEKPVEEAILAIAVYEIFDRPDYRAFVDAFEGVNDRWDLEFFKVHAGVEHFEMFTPFVEWFYAKFPDAELRFHHVADFVLGKQERMWAGLLETLETPVTV